MRTGIRVGMCGWFILAASAASAADRGFYFGASAGQASYDFDTPAPTALVIPDAGLISIIVSSPNPIFIPALPAPGPVFVGNAIEARPLLWIPGEDDEGTGWTLTAGYRINRYLAVEASYVNLGTLSATNTIDFPPILGIGPLSFHRELETAGPALTAFGMLPLSASWQLYARAGMLFADTDLTTSVNGTSNSSSFDSDVTTWGAGAQYDWGGHWSARLEFQRSLDVGGDDVASDADVDSISLGFLYRL
jgi:opacity protein-like surface antigen